jgi:hypothetical protein
MQGFLMSNNYGTVILLLILTACLAITPASILAEDSQHSHACFDPVKTELIRGGDDPQTISVELNGAEDIYLVATFGPDDYDSDQAIWAEPKLTDLDGNVIDMTTLQAVKAECGWGTLFVNTDQKLRAITIVDQHFEKGFWAHGPSRLHFHLGGQYAKFEVTVGIDSGAGSKGSVEFQVLSYPVAMPAPTDYAKRSGTASSPLPVPPLSDATEFEFNAEAAQVLLDQGVEELLFVRRYTLNANHVYTEYVNSRWTPGGGLSLLDLKSGKVRDLLPELNEGVVNRFDVSFDGTKILFDYKNGAREGYRIYEVNSDGTDLRQLTFPEPNEADLVAAYGNSGYHHGSDDLHPCYLPDGGIAFVTTRCQYGVLCNAGDIFTTKNLYRMDGDGDNMTPLTSSALSEASPAVLPDGRILYHRWEYVDKTAGSAKCLWSVNPDGSGSSEVYGNTITFPETMIYARPIPDAAHKIVMLGTSHCCPNNAMGAVIVIDTTNDIRSPDTMNFITDDIHALHHTGFHFKNEEGEWFHDKTGEPGRLFKDPYPLSEELFIVSHKPKGKAWSDPRGYDLSILDAEGTDTLLLKDESISCWHPYPLRARVTPPVRVATYDETLAEQDLARCVVTDIYVGMDNVDRGEVKYIRILEEVARPWAARKSWYKDDRDGMAHSALGNGFLGLKVQYGIVPVEEDGSAQFTVPANRNIYFQALDANYMAIQTERTYVNYMPGEVRSCIGCHETPDDAPSGPAMRFPSAMMRAPSTPAPQPGETSGQRLFDYDRQVQPIWDRHCTECHDEIEPYGGLNLAGTPTGTYSVSYNQLIQLSRGETQLLGNRKLRDENVGSAPIEYIPPYQLGALTSPLIAWLSQGRVEMSDSQLQAYVEYLTESHQDVAISDEELLTLSNWVDVNCPYHPSYWGRLNAMYEGHPSYRPVVTFEEALMRTVPESFERSEEEGANWTTSIE